MPDLIRYPVPFWIALKLHFVPRLRGNDNPIVFNYWSDNSRRSIIAVVISMFRLAFG